MGVCDLWGFAVLLRMKKKVKRTSDLRHNSQTRRSRDKGRERGWLWVSEYVLGTEARDVWRETISS